MILKVHHLKKILKNLPDSMCVMFKDKHTGDIKDIASHEVKELFTDGYFYSSYKIRKSEESEECLLLTEEEQAEKEE